MDYHNGFFVCFYCVDFIYIHLIVFLHTVNTFITIEWYDSSNKCVIMLESEVLNVCLLVETWRCRSGSVVYASREKK